MIWTLLFSSVKVWLFKNDCNFVLFLFFLLSIHLFNKTCCPHSWSLSRPRKLECWIRRWVQSRKTKQNKNKSKARKSKFNDRVLITKRIIWHFIRQINVPFHFTRLSDNYVNYPVWGKPQVFLFKRFFLIWTIKLKIQPKLSKTIVYTPVLAC